MKTYARIDGGKVAELFATDADIASLFHPDLVWIECTADVSVGWNYASGLLTAPTVVDEATTPVPQEVPMAAARIILLRNGIDDVAVKTAIAASTLTAAQQAEALIDWEFRTTVRRTSSLTEMLGTALALSESQKDAMFVAASELQ